MGLSKATLQIAGSNTIQVFFNPNEYTIQNANKFSWKTIPGLPRPLGQYVSGEAATLTVELFFSTYEAAEDVRLYTNQITSLMNVDTSTSAPPIITFIWGSLNFRGVLENVTQKFTMFLNDGTPVRATLNVTMREYLTLQDQTQTAGNALSSLGQSLVLNEGQQLWSVANNVYNDASEWRQLASANNIDNPRTLESGLSIIAPKLGGLF